MTSLTNTIGPDAPAPAFTAVGGDVPDYFALLKPRVMVLVIFTALVGMVVSGVVIVAGLVWGISAVDYVTRLSSTCAQLGPGDYVDADGRTVTCG